MRKTNRSSGHIQVKFNKQITTHNQTKTNNQVCMAIKIKIIFQVQSFEKQNLPKKAVRIRSVFFFKSVRNKLQIIILL